MAARATVIALFAVTLGATCDERPSTAATGSAADVVAPLPRDPRFAVPLSEPGLPNLHRVADGLYRGAQPDPAGFARLAEMKVRTVVNLRSMHSDEDEIRAAGLPEGTFRYVSIPMATWDVDDEHLAAFLAIAADPAARPLFFHCQHGADRTGTMAAAYRVVVEGWSKEDALREMTDGGFGFHGVWINLVDYMKKLDVDGMRAAAGIR